MPTHRGLDARDRVSHVIVKTVIPSLIASKVWITQCSPATADFASPLLQMRADCASLFGFLVGLGWPTSNSNDVPQRTRHSTALQANMQTEEIQLNSEMDGDRASEIGACQPLEYDEWESEVNDFELEQDSRLIQAIVFCQPHTQPIQRLLYCSVETRFKFMSYPVAQDTNPGAEYLVYSVYSEKYRDAGQPINLAGRGRLMVFRENTLRRIDCPGIKTWERRARQSAQAEVDN
ncbi:hypothetical protein C8R47DRAFT_1063364 [Mycena vitilis]|nr:hypothetical protein C8R47DRAFT_1063364 [Mycena vitilis]